MLMSITYSTMSLFFSVKLKYSWELMTTTMLTMSIMFMSLNPMTNYLYMGSKTSMLDSLSMIMIMLSMWITPMMMLASYKLKHKKMNENLFMMTILLMLYSLMMCFSSNNLIMFYIWFELSLIPTILLIMLWGNQPEREKASLYIILYTITASLPLLMIILKMSTNNLHTNFFLKYYNLPMMFNSSFSWVLLTTAFMVKIPIFSLHLWLPKAHVEAPVAGSMILAAILLKLGGYGLIRMNKLINKEMSIISYFIMSICFIGAIITNTLCLRQTDLKALIAYSSIGHMSLFIISTLSNSKLGQYGSLIIMLTHGLTSSCLFMMTNQMYEKAYSRNIILLNSPATILPSSSLMWTIILSLNMALPPSMNIIGEMIIMMASFFIMNLTITMTMLISFTTTLYSLYVYSMINHGNQLKMLNHLTQMKSLDLMNIISHLWPMLATITIPTKMMLWC